MVHSHLSAVSTILSNTCKIYNWYSALKWSIRTTKGLLQINQSDAGSKKKKWKQCWGTGLPAELLKSTLAVLIPQQSSRVHCATCINTHLKQTQQPLLICLYLIWEGKDMLSSLLVTWCTTSLTFNNCTLCPHCIYVFCIYLRTNSDLCYLQHKLIGFYNRDEKCLQRGTDWVFKYSGLRFVFKGSYKLTAAGDFIRRHVRKCIFVETQVMGDRIDVSYSTQ